MKPRILSRRSKDELNSILTAISPNEQVTFFELSNTESYLLIKKNWRGELSYLSTTGEFIELKVNGYKITEEQLIELFTPEPKFNLAEVAKNFVPGVTLRSYSPQDFIPPMPLPDPVTITAPSTGTPLIEPIIVTSNSEDI